MRTLNIKISDFEFEQLGLNKSTFSLAEWIDILEKKVAKQTLEKSIRLADQYGLSKMTMEEINEEVTSYRNAKDNT